MSEQKSTASKRRRSRGPKGPRPTEGPISTDVVRVLPLGGLGEIGKNMTVVETEDDLILIDAGVRFPSAEMHGIDLVLPDFNYVRERASKLRAIFITHGHEDHTGAVPWMLRELNLPTPPPIYGRPLPMAMVRNKLSEHQGLGKVTCHDVEPGDRIQAGTFECEFVHMTHSIPDAAAIAVRTPRGTVLFTGDFRFDQTPVDGKPADFARLVDIGREGVTLLCGDSTNADRPGFAASESDIGPALTNVFRACEGRIVVTSFASNIHRVQQVITAAERLDRHVVLLGRSMVNNVKIGQQLGHIRAKQSTIVQPRDVERLPDHKVVVMTTGSQGEPLAALRRMAGEEHRQIRLREGDTVVFSATPIPGNERAIEETIGRLVRLGCRVITAKDAPIHTSGHGYREELKLMLNLVKPQHLMPMHGDARRLQLHADLGVATGIHPEKVFIGENGRPLDLHADGVRFAAPVQAGMILVDGLDLGDPTAVALRDRSDLSQDGVIFVAVTISQQDGETVGTPEVVLRGVPLISSAEEMTKQLRGTIEKALDEAFDAGIEDIDGLQQAIKDGVMADVHKRTRRAPVVLPVVMEV